MAEVPDTAKYGENSSLCAGGGKSYENRAISRRLDRVENKQVKAKALLKRLRGLLQRAMPAVSRGSAIKNVGVAERGLALGWALGKAECAVL